MLMLSCKFVTHFHTVNHCSWTAELVFSSLIHVNEEVKRWLPMQNALSLYCLLSWNMPEHLITKKMSINLESTTITARITCFNIRTQRILFTDCVFIWSSQQTEIISLALTGWFLREGVHLLWDRDLSLHIYIKSMLLGTIYVWRERQKQQAGEICITRNFIYTSHQMSG